MEDLAGAERRANEIVAALTPGVFGQRIRRARMKQGISIREVASRASVSKTSLVRMEQGRSCHANTILKVCGALGLHIDRFLDAGEEAEAIVHTRADDRWYDLTAFGQGPLGGLDRPLSRDERRRFAEPRGATPMMMLKSHLADGRVWAGLLELYGVSEQRQHQGEEFVFVLAGRAEIRIGGRKIELGEGESVSFWSSEEHAYGPAEGSHRPALLLCVRVDA